ncbi:MAG: WD40 repeat domain-containing protein [Chloroflexi bacterium]|nr:WD40 repeat domain-containing protein [Chloroflexota bacterium]
MGRFPLLNLYRYLLYLGAVLIIAAGFFYGLKHAKTETEDWDYSTGQYITHTSTDEADFFQYFLVAVFFSIPLIVVAELVKLSLFVEDHLYHMRYHGVIVNTGGGMDYVPNLPPPPKETPKLPAALSNLVRNEILQKTTPTPNAAVKNMPAHEESINALALFPDGKRLVSASNDKTLKVWDTDTFDCIATLKGHAAWVKGVVITPSGQQIVSCSMDRTLKIWNAQSGEALQTLSGHSDSVNALAITPDGRKLVSGSSDRTLKIWDVASGSELQTLVGHEDAVNTLTISPDGSKVISAARDLSLKIWDLQSGAEIYTLKGHTAKINTIVFLADGKQVLSTSDDGTFRFWDLETGDEIRGAGERTAHNHIVTAFTVYAQGRKGVSVSSDHVLRIWNLEQKTLEKSINRISATPPLACAVSIYGTHTYVGNKAGELLTVSLE